MTPERKYMFFSSVSVSFPLENSVIIIMNFTHIALFIKEIQQNDINIMNKN